MGNHLNMKKKCVCFLSFWAVLSTAPTLTLYKDICGTGEVSGWENDFLLVPESGGGGSIPMS